MVKSINNYKIEGLDKIDWCSLYPKAAKFFRVKLKNIQTGKIRLCYFGCDGINLSTVATITDDLEDKLLEWALSAIEENIDSIEDISAFELDHDRFLFLYEIPDWCREIK